MELILHEEMKTLPVMSINLSITYLLTPWSRVLLEKLTGSAASQEIRRLFGTRRFLTETQKRQPPVPILNQLHPIPATPSHFLKIPLNIILPSTSGSPQFPLVYETMTFNITAIWG